MANEEYIKRIVAAYLVRNHYDSTYAHFLQESQLKPVNDDEYEHLEEILSERIKYNETLSKLSSLTVASAAKPWDHTRKHFREINCDANKGFVIHVNSVGDRIVVSTAARKLFVLDASSLNIIHKITTKVVVKTTIVYNETLFAAGMDGTVTCYDTNMTELRQFKIHSRIVIKMDIVGGMLCSIGMDGYLKVHSLQGELQSELKLLSTPTALVVDENKGDPQLFVARTEFTQVAIYNVELKETRRIALNTAEFSTHAFSVLEMCMLHDRHLVVATNHTPFLRLIMCSLPKTSGETHYDCVVANIPTKIAQDVYSQPIVRPLNSGVLVGADNGLWCVDLYHGESWQVDKTAGRTKTLSVGRRIVWASADKQLFYV